EEGAGRNLTCVSFMTPIRKRNICGFARPADPRTLIRRLTLDLTGLPPTKLEIDDFLGVTPSLRPSVPLSAHDGETERKSDREKYQILVRRLLASPHYGEQQARHWFDVVRYADTAG